MNERDVLEVQIQTVLEDLIQAQQALDSGVVAHQLLGRVSIDLDDAFKQPRQQLKGLVGQLNAGAPLPDCWARFRQVREETGPVLQECLALIQGSLARANRVAADVCEVVDALLDEVSSRTPVTWERFTVLADHEFLGDLAEIVRVRFPEVSMWSFPIAAHELGHFIAPRLRYDDESGPRLPFQELLDAAADPLAAARLHEHVADLFATYMVGPCFAIACLFLRFDPGTPESPWSDHPSDVRRINMMLHALERLDGKVADYGPIAGRLRGLWRATSLALQPSADGAGSSDETGADQLCDQILDLLGTVLPARAAYRGWERARELAPGLADWREPPPDAATLMPWDVINAVWLCRLDHFEGDMYAMRDLGERALKLCRKTLAASGRLGGV
jgi:hypothetical protein